MKVLSKTFRKVLLAAGVVTIAATMSAGAASANDNARIIGGQEATVSQYPWMVALLKATGGSNDFDRQFCGGTLIHPRLVLTAAHCIVHPASEMQVLVGRTTLSGTGGEKINVQRTIVHPSYHTPLYHSNDVAVLQLASPASQTPAALRERELGVSPNTLMRTIGWGLTACANTDTDLDGSIDCGNAPSADSLLSVDVPLVPDSDCTGILGANSYDPGSMACAGYAAAGKDSCQGDSGGPLVVQNPNSEWRLVGVVSFGRGCGMANTPGVYAWVRSGALRDWVDQRIAEMNVVVVPPKPVKPVQPAKPATPVKPASTPAGCGSARIARAPLTMYGRAVKVRVHVSQQQRCRTTMTIRALRGGRKVTLGSKSVLLRPAVYENATSRRVKVHLNATGRRFLARTSSSRVEITLTGPDGARLGRGTTTLRGPKRGSRCCATP